MKSRAPLSLAPRHPSHLGAVASTALRVTETAGRCAYLCLACHVPRSLLSPANKLISPVVGLLLLLLLLLLLCCCAVDLVVDVVVVVAVVLVVDVVVVVVVAVTVAAAMALRVRQINFTNH